ncbi:ATP synthase F1 subunit gamma [Mesomycoplasma molare]|uniref:ATP synthase gamma chain n=1 Tax=Mesomycoplasma molare TaxID=171288 RepID=A0ABY5TWJ6_9BACT|nr:ATP synthase F1 subunit gamma [Mesomycoplasma molare]UWD34570.1 ATP synthase F1 subunit gamma [Mesomycoplasma molare]
MPSIQKIKTRINLIENTRKITKAMELLSSAKLRKAKNNFSSIQEYANSIENILDTVYEKTDVKNNSFFSNKEKQNSIYIIITSDLGLCGGYNNNVYKITKNKLKNDDKLIIFGNKGISLFKDYEKNIIKKIGNYGDDLNYLIVREIIDLVIGMIKNKEIGSINLVYTKFINSVTFEPFIKQLFPLENSALESNKTKNKVNDNILLEFEPSPEVILENLLPLYLGSFIYNALAESKISEMSSRRSAMENASNNADEITNNLQIVFNRGRQSSITQEITEIIGGNTSK